MFFFLKMYNLHKILHNKTQKLRVLWQMVAVHKIIMYKCKIFQSTFACTSHVLHSSATDRADKFCNNPSTSSLQSYSILMKNKYNNLSAFHRLTSAIATRGGLDERVRSLAEWDEKICYMLCFIFILVYINNNV